MTADRRATASFAPVPPAVVTPPPAKVALSVARFSIAPSTLHAARAANKRRHVKARKATHARVRIALTRAAPVTITVLVGKSGRKQGSQCRPVTRKNRRAKACTRFVALAGQRSLKAAASQSFVFTTRWHRRQLAPGSYEISVSALDTTTGVRIAPTVRHFRVTR